MSQAQGGVDATLATGQLALCLQEAFTVAVRLRSDQPISLDAGAFRAHVKQLLSTADRSARAAGYHGDQVKLAVYAFIAFLDETVHTSNQPNLAGWHRRPLQEEVFGDLLAGETFFQNLRSLLAQQDSHHLADVLEVYQLCLLLGFKGKYAGGGEGELQALMATAQDKIMRVRGGVRPVSEAWQLPEAEHVEVGRDPWLVRLLVVLAVAVVVVVALWVGYTVSLNRKVRALDQVAAVVLHGTWPDTGGEAA